MKINLTSYYKGMIIRLGCELVISTLLTHTLLKSVNQIFK